MLHELPESEVKAVGCSCSAIVVSGPIYGHARQHSRLIGSASCVDMRNECLLQAQAQAQALTGCLLPMLEYMPFRRTELSDGADSVN